MNINLAAPADIGAAIELHEAAGFSFRIPALRAAMVGDIILADIYPGDHAAADMLEHDALVTLRQQLRSAAA